jgi:dipeptidase E
MRLYLSSYKLGNEKHKLKSLINSDKPLAYISNALDWSNDAERRVGSEQSDMNELADLNIPAQKLDLRDYFGKPEELKNQLQKFSGIFVRGGNAFVLRQAFSLSGLDKILQELKATDLLYIAYSAGVCVLGPTLKGLDLMDRPNEKPYGEIETIWEGLGIIDYVVVPHYKSDHNEASLANKAVAYLKENNIAYKTMSDGDVVISE